MDFPLNKDKLSTIFNLNPLKLTKQLESFQDEDTQWASTYRVVQPNYVFGIEVEVEKIINNLLVPKHKSYWNTVTDGSLRNHGVEFVSLPLKAFQVEKALKQVQYQLQNNTPEFSERTSVHVHMNIRDLTLDQILALTLVYTCVEPLLFKWVGHNRNKNTFCIPLNNTNFYDLYKDITRNPTNTPRMWMKYTAFNLIPISSKGTVEFRHMYGTLEIDKLITWINLLSYLKLYVKQHTLKEITGTIQFLNTNSFYTEFVSDIFKSYSKELLSNTDNLQQDLESAITYCKLASIVE